MQCVKRAKAAGGTKLSLSFFLQLSRDPAIIYYLAVPHSVVLLLHPLPFGFVLLLLLLLLLFSLFRARTSLDLGNRAFSILLTMH